ncbi:MAG: hypothetical protein ISS52_01475 [Dehalococcoidia bacterium]|nr:hypothetical protein [Dehalococcoidia bacterium]
MAAYLADQFIAWINSLAQDNVGIALTLILGLAALSGLLLVAALRLLRTLLPFLVVTGTVVLCWHTGLLDQCYEWLLSLV